MKKIRIFLLVFTMLTMLQSKADLILTAEDVEYFLQNYEQWSGNTIVYTQTMYGSYDGDLGRWIAPLNRSFPSAQNLNQATWDENEGYYIGSPYGFALLVRDHLDDSYFHYYDLGEYFYFYYNMIEDYESMYGIYQMYSDEPYDPEDEFANPITGAYFSADLLWYSASEIILIVYE